MRGPVDFDTLRAKMATRRTSEDSVNRLSKAQLSDLSAHVDNLREKHGKLEDEINAFNETKIAAFQKVEAALEAYNNAVEEAESFRETIHADQESFYDDKSEKWQEGERGRAYSEWREAWSNPLDTVEINEPDGIDVPDDNASTSLEDFPNAPDEV